MALHGHTKIELRNVKTGEEKVFEKDNMVTDYLKDMFQPIGGLMTYNLSRTTGTKSKTTLFGGIVLFEDPVEIDNKHNYIPPAGNRQIGHGGSITSYSTNDMTNGVYNTELSGAVDNGYKFVWDWNLEHGNGQISSVCLTTQEGGNCGFGKPNINDVGSSFYATLRNFITEAFYLGKNSVSEYYYGLLGASLEKGYVISVYLNTANKPVFYKNELYTEKTINPLTMSMSGVAPVKSYKTKTLDLSAYNFGTYMRVCWSDGYIYITTANSVSANATFTLLKVDPDDFSIVKTWTVTNTTGYSIPANSVGSNGQLYHGAFPIGVLGDYLFISTSSNFVFAINLENNTDVHQLTMEDGSNYTLGQVSGIGMQFNKNFLLLSRNMGFSNGATSGCTGIVSAKDFVVRFLNASPVQFCQGTGSAGNYGSGAIPTDNPLIWLAFYKQNGTSAGNVNNYMIWNPLGLVTINNLDEPVTKTADMTMRITYTVTQKTEE